MFVRSKLKDAWFQFDVSLQSWASRFDFLVRSFGETTSILSMIEPGLPNEKENHNPGRLRFRFPFALLVRPFQKIAFTLAASSFTYSSLGSKPLDEAPRRSRFQRTRFWPCPGLCSAGSKHWMAVTPKKYIGVVFSKMGISIVGS